MTVTTWAAILCVAAGTGGIVRGTLIVAFGGYGRFRFDPAISLITGFSLVVLGQHLFGHS